MSLQAGGTHIVAVNWRVDGTVPPLTPTKQGQTFEQDGYGYRKSKFL